MNLSHRPALKRLVPATVLLVAAGGLTAAGLSAAQADTAATTPALQLVTPVATQTIERGKGENAYLYGLGVYVVAQKAAVEIRTLRTDYTKPIGATLAVGSGDTATKTALPSSLFTHVDTIDNFFTLGVTDSAGKLVKKVSVPFCPNDYSAARAYPDGAATSPYPYQCGSHPFAIGSVFGIQRGWSVPAMNSWQDPASFKGKDGTYSVQLLINKPWRDALKMTKAQSTGTIKVKVKTVDYGGKGAAVSAASSMPDMPGMSTAATGKLSPQMAILEAARVRALGHASKPAASAPTKKLSAKAVEADTPKPDLRALPAYQISLERKTVKGKPTKTTYIDFGATVWNAGPSPLVVDGFRRPGTALMDAYQYFFDNSGNEVGSAPAGTLQWDPRVGHQHWHFTAFASYRLLDSSQKTALISGKEAFCLAATDAINLNVENVDLRPDSTDLATACGEEGALSVREVLATGWGDTYSQSRPGQSFDITKVPNGTYYIEVLANPDNKLAEGSTTNNRALRKIKLGGTVGGKRTIKVYDYKGIKAP